MPRMNPVVGEWGPDRGDGEFGAPDDPVDSALAVTLAGGVLPHWPQLAGGLVDTLGLEVAKRAGEHLAVQADDVVAPVVAGRVRGLGVEQPDLAGALYGEVASWEAGPVGGACEQIVDAHA